MKHFKNPATSQLFAFNSDGSQDEFIPDGLVAITDAEADAIRNPPPSPVERIKACEMAVQTMLDDSAEGKGYDSIVTAVTYASLPEGSPFQAEGAAFNLYRAQCWARAYEVLAEVQAGTRVEPTPEQFVALMPEKPAILVVPA